MAISGLLRTLVTRSGASVPAARSLSSLSQQPAAAHRGSPPGLMATSGLPNRLAKSGASALAARSLSSLSQQSRRSPAAHLGSLPDPTAISGLPNRLAKLGASHLASDSRRGRGTTCEL